MPKEKDTKLVVIISSTAKDLPEHRHQVTEGCQRMGFDTSRMETLPALDKDAAAVSVAMVQKANIYLGVFAHRYGYVPDGSDISVTEMEYNEAVKHNIPRLIFFIDEKSPVLPDTIEIGRGGEKLKALKERIAKDRVIGKFTTPQDLRGLVIQALEAFKAEREATDEPRNYSPHFVHPIPKPPEAYIAHYYALLQTGKIIGRRRELDILTHWITRSPHPMFHVIAIGGMGKSALTWHWFHHIAPQEWPKMRGRIWWSFYESDGHFENFVTRSLAYVSGQTEDEIHKLNLRDRCDSLLQVLNREPYLVVLDGLERLLTAYARMDAPYLRDDDLDEKTHNAIYDAKGYPQGFYQSAVSRHALRLATDPNVGRFLYRLIQLQASRVLTSSRLFPADLQRPDGYPIPGCDAMFLQGLSESDALELWREYGAKGSSDVMLPIFRSFGCHPLVLKVFAGKVANYRLAPGDFDAWHQANPDFKPYGELVQVQSHIFKHALRDLCDSERQTLNLVAAFRMPAGIETLQSLLVDRDAVPVSEYDVEKRLEAPFRTLGELDSALTHLEDRGLLGWDRMANRYDLHPIVRGVVWDLLQVDHRHAVWEKLRSHLNTIRPTASEKIESLDDLAYAIEHFDKLVSLARYEEAFGVFRHHLDDATSHRLSAAQVRLSLLERLFPNGIDNPPRLEKIRAQSWVLDTLASAFNVAGRPAKAAELFARAVEMDRHPKDWENLAVGLCNCSERVP